MWRFKRIAGLMTPRYSYITLPSWRWLCNDTQSTSRGEGGETSESRVREGRVRESESTERCGGRAGVRRTHREGVHVDDHEVQGHGEADGSQQPHVLPGRHAHQGLVLRHAGSRTTTTAAQITRYEWFSLKRPFKND